MILLFSLLSVFISRDLPIHVNKKAVISSVLFTAVYPVSKTVMVYGKHTCSVNE